jgi:cyclophilin family peptidyl-prolyl cis-trans isomerase/HEAT repeat protein
MGEDVRVLMRMTRAGVEGPRLEMALLAIRALGRYESREFIPDLISLLPHEKLRDATTRAIVQSFRGPLHPSDRDGEQARRLLDILNTLAVKDDRFVGTAAEAIGDLPYENARDAEQAQGALRQMLRRAEANTRMPLPSIVRGIETFARRHRKLSPLSDDMIERLREIAVATDPRRRAASPLAAAALVTAGQVDIDTLRAIAAASDSDYKRRLAAVVLGGSALAIDEPERVILLRKLLTDPDMPVRYEAVRAWARRVTPAEGCELLRESLKDPSYQVMLAVIDALGDVCKADINVTDFLTVEARTPPTDRSWHRAAHALVSLAKRAPERVRIPLTTAFVPHPVWEVRMYAARAAALLKDAPLLERLAMDPHDNVREAALPVLRQLKGSESDPIFVEALKRSDYQLLMTAANSLKGATTTPELAGALLTALVRVTADQKETSRDVRLALIERLHELGTPDQAEHLGPLLRDFDIPVASSAYGLYQKWQRPAFELFAPVPLPRPALPSRAELDDERDAVVEMQSGAKFGMRLLMDEAPLSATRFKRLAAAGYYNGLTFHRIVANFIIQGGSPGANEYSGDGPFMRDEIGVSHGPFTVGVSTRGRDTGDAQIFINLVENQRLDPDYTVFARVCDVAAAAGADGPGREAVEGIREGDAIASITLKKYDPCQTNQRQVRPSR